MFFFGYFRCSAAPESVALKSLPLTPTVMSSPTASSTAQAAAMQETAEAEAEEGEEAKRGSHDEDEDGDEGNWRNVVVGGSLIPPTNFGLIEENMYRSGMVNELNFPFLEQLDLRTIVYLASDEPADKLADFIDDQAIHLHYLVADDNDAAAADPTAMPWKPISEHVVLSAMHVLLDVSMHPVLVMCSHGRHRTGTIIGCLRKLQLWSLSAIFEEYDRHADGRGRLANEQFIELFDTDLMNVPTKNQPPWLRNGT